MLRDHHPPLRDVTADRKNTASSIVAYWTVFIELLPGNALIKSVTLFIQSDVVMHTYCIRIRNTTNLQY
jgi:hypothetical protein